jgi:hypothetical protein
VARSENPLLERQRPTQPSFGGVQLSAARVDRCEVGERDRDLVMVRSERCLQDRQGAVQQLIGLVVPAGGVEKHGQRRTLGGGVGTVGAGRCLADGTASRAAASPSAGLPAAWASPPML